MSKDTRYYTTHGDDGYTDLLGDQRVPKHHDQPAAYGDVDETQAALGMARALMGDADAKGVILTVQRDLYHLMAELAATRKAAPQFRVIDAARVAWLEAQTDAFGAGIHLPKAFTVSGDSPAGAALDLARTVCRRAERGVVKLHFDGRIENPDLLRYLNRLSSLLFVLSKYEDALGGQSEVTITKTIDA
jgi:cob(I)alamin adenosyltransferase